MSDYFRFDQKIEFNKTKQMKQKHKVKTKSKNL